MPRWVTIGALARATGIPVKTIRHYSDAGVLPPAGRSTGRYRLYRDTDRGRLEVIRLLRSLDFDLSTIATLVGHDTPIRSGLRAQLAVVDARMRALKRTRAVIARAAEAPTDARAVETLARLHAVAALDSAERGAVLRETMEGYLADGPSDAAWRARLWDVAFKDLPDDLSDAQWSALVELIDLVQDADFGRALADQGRAYWSEARPASPMARRRLQRLAVVAARLADTQAPFTTPRAARLTARFVALSAEAAGRKPTKTFAAWLLTQGAKHDRRSERFWILVATLRGWPITPRPDVRGYQWLFAALADREGRLAASRAARK